MKEEPTYDVLQKVGITVLFATFALMIYSWLVRFQCLPKPEWFKAIEGPY